MRLEPLILSVNMLFEWLRKEHCSTLYYAHISTLHNNSRIELTVAWYVEPPPFQNPGYRLVSLIPIDITLSSWAA